MPSLTVLLNDTPVGVLADRADGRISFRFLQTYLNLGERPVLGQRFEDDLDAIYSGKRPGQLPAFFANLLPEGQVRAVIEDSLGMSGLSDVELLAQCAMDLPGALLLRSDDAAQSGGPNGAHARGREGRDIKDLGLRFSLAGVQLKFSLIDKKNKFFVPSRDQAGNWIVKVPVPQFAFLPENEHAVMRWAAASGFEVPETRLVDAEQLGALGRHLPNGGKALAVKRFDRAEGRRIHQEDFNQVVGYHPRADKKEKYDFSYEALGKLIAAIAGPESTREFLRRLLFVIATGNNDAHLKNWSLTYPDAIHPALSPLYDQVSTIAWPQCDRTWALKLGGGRDFGLVDRLAICSVAEKAQVSRDEANQIVDLCLQTLQSSYPVLMSSGMPGLHVSQIQKHWNDVPLLREFGPLR